jgi:hypothetical protein
VTPASLNPVILYNARSVKLDKIPWHTLDQFQELIVQGVADEQRISACFGVASAQPGAVDLYVILANDSENHLTVARTTVTEKVFPSLTPRCPQIHLFEREIAEQFGLLPEGHPWLKPCATARVGGGDATHGDAPTEHRFPLPWVISTGRRRRNS